jgi:hypothetical protein
MRNGVTSMEEATVVAGISGIRAREEATEDVRVGEYDQCGTCLG